MKYHILLILLSALIIACKPGRKLQTNEKASSIAAQSDASFKDFRLDNIQSKTNNSITSGLFFYPIDPTKESYVKFADDSSITSKNAAVNLNKKDNTEVINSHTEAQLEHTETIDHTEQTNTNRHTAEQNTSQVTEFRSLILSLVMLVIAVIGYMLIRRR